MKATLIKSKVEGEPLDELLRDRALGASVSGPPKKVWELFNLPTTIVDASTQPDACDENLPTNDAAAWLVAPDTSV